MGYAEMCLVAYYDAFRRAVTAALLILMSMGVI
jgi:hypothetical protein